MIAIENDRYDFVDALLRENTIMIADDCTQTLLDLANQQSNYLKKKI